MRTASRHGRVIGTIARLALVAALPGCTDPTTSATASPLAAATTTPIQHVVVVFQENVPFDRYFGVYPHARNPPGEPRFVARADTPTVNGHQQSSRPAAATPAAIPRSAWATSTATP